MFIAYLQFRVFGHGHTDSLMPSQADLSSSCLPAFASATALTVQVILLIDHTKQKLLAVFCICALL